MKTTYVGPRCEMVEWNKHDIITTSTQQEATTRYTGPITLPEDEED